MPKFTNISDGPRGLHTTGGLVMVEKGQEVEVDLAENEEPNDEWFARAGSRAAKEALAEEEAPAEPEAARESGNKRT